MDSIDPVPEPTETPQASEGYSFEVLPTSASRAACIASWRNLERWEVTSFGDEEGSEDVAAYAQGREAREGTTEIGAGREASMRRDQESTKVAPRGEMAPMDVTTTRRRSIVERARESCQEWSELCIARGWGGCGCCGRNFYSNEST